MDNTRERSTSNTIRFGYNGSDGEASQVLYGSFSIFLLLVLLTTKNRVLPTTLSALTVTESMSGLSRAGLVIITWLVEGASADLPFSLRQAFGNVAALLEQTEDQEVFFFFFFSLFL